MVWQHHGVHLITWDTLLHYTLTWTGDETPDPSVSSRDASHVCHDVLTNPNMHVRRTCTVSKSSLLSQRTLDSLTRLISASCSRVKDEGQPPFSYQNLSPCLKLWNCLPMRQARVGPTILPGRGLSVMPADHRSISSGEAYILLNP